MLDAACLTPRPDATRLREIRAGLFNSLSVEFRAIKEKFEGGVRRIGRRSYRVLLLSIREATREALWKSGPVPISAKTENGRRRVWL